MKCRISSVPPDNNEYSPISDMPQEPGLRKRFNVFLAGKTNEAHRDFVRKLKGFGQTEVYSPEECDYLVVFCPVASRVQTDVNEALDKTSAFGNKPIILVVMHHTFDPNHILPRGSGLETNPNVHLTVNCLFHENRFLQCASNDEAFRQVQRCLGVSQNFWMDPCKWVPVIFAVLVVFGLVMAVIVFAIKHIKSD